MPSKKKKGTKRERESSEEEELISSTSEDDGGDSEDVEEAPSPAPRPPRSKVFFNPRLSKRRRRRMDDSDSDGSRDEQYGKQPADPALSAPQGHVTAKDIVKLVQGHYGGRVAGETRPAKQPASVVGGVMKDYQLVGLEWLHGLYKRNVGGILGDDMGVGKTLQAVSLVARLVEEGELAPGKPPALILVPLSTVQGWVTEFTRWAPSVDVLAFVGAKEEREAVRKGVETGLAAKGVTMADTLYLPAGQHCVVTTPELFLLEDFFLSAFDYPLLIIDEGHRLKNPKSQLTQLLDAPKARCGLGHVPRKLLLTGTALQNTMLELWSLLHCVAPRLFTDPTAFTATWFPNPKEDAGQQGHLRELLSYCMLRRVKEEVLKDLPGKKEFVLHCPLSPSQQALYRWVLQKNAPAVFGEQRRSLQNVVVQLRKVSNHPYMFPGVEPEPFTLADHLVINSGKLSLLDRLLAVLRKQGHRVLLFSQFTTTLDILQDYLHLRGWNYERLDGSVRSEERFHAVESFQTEDTAFVFLLSTRAGGLGLNLTAADVVIFYDSDWNPQVDKQAQERVYRIGQRRNVTVYRLISRGTVEDIILSRAVRKMQLAETVLDGKADGEGAASSAELLDLILAGVKGVAGEDDEGDPGGRGTTHRIYDTVSAFPSRYSGYKTFLTTPVAKLLGAAKSVAYEPTEDRRGAHLVYDGKDYTQEKRERETELEVLRRIAVARDAKEAVESTPSPAEPPRTKEETLFDKETRRRNRLAKTWNKDGYSSSQVAPAPGFPDTVDDLVCELQKSAPEAKPVDADLIGETGPFHVNGDVTVPETNPMVAKHLPDIANLLHVVVVPVNNSGSWGVGGLFSAVDRTAHGVGKGYETAHTMQDVRLGDVHLFPAREAVCVALVVVQRSSRGGEVDAKLFTTALQKLSDAAERLRKGGATPVLHFPRCGGRDWYTLEKLLGRYVDHTPCFVHYFARPRGARRPTSPPKAKPIKEEVKKEEEHVKDLSPFTMMYTADEGVDKVTRAESEVEGRHVLLLGWDTLEALRVKRLLLLCSAVSVDKAGLLMAASRGFPCLVLVPDRSKSAELIPNDLSALHEEDKLRVVDEEWLLARVN